MPDLEPCAEGYKSMERIGRSGDEIRERLTERDLARICQSHGLAPPTEIIPEYRGNECVCYHIDDALFIACVVDEDIQQKVEVLLLLEGIVEKTKTFSLGLRYRIFQDSEMGLEYSYTRVQNRQTEEAKLPSSDKRKQPWEAGSDWTQNIFQATLSLRY